MRIPRSEMNGDAPSRPDVAPQVGDLSMPRERREGARRGDCAQDRQVFSSSAQCRFALGSARYPEKPGERAPGLVQREIGIASGAQSAACVCRPAFSDALTSAQHALSASRPGCLRLRDRGCGPVRLSAQSPGPWRACPVAGSCHPILCRWPRAVLRS
jgi:hypothetical protein